MDFGFAVGTNARMELPCGQKRPRLSAGKALATEVEARSGGGRLSKVAARFGT
jgi:hypothetical protein